MSRQHSTDIWYDYQEVNIKLCIPGFAQLKPTAPKREKILAAAAELLLTEGFHALTQHAVAARAGIDTSCPTSLAVVSSSEPELGSRSERADPHT